MTIVRTSTPHKYVGVNADTKPTAGVPAGSSFFEIDTGDEYFFDGTATWGQKLYPAA